MLFNTKVHPPWSPSHGPVRTSTCRVPTWTGTRRGVIESHWKTTFGFGTPGGTGQQLHLGEVFCTFLVGEVVVIVEDPGRWQEKSESCKPTNSIYWLYHIIDKKQCIIYNMSANSLYYIYPTYCRVEIQIDTCGWNQPEIDWFGCQRNGVIDEFNFRMLLGVFHFLMKYGKKTLGIHDRAWLMDL